MDYTHKTVVVIVADNTWRAADRTFWIEEFKRMLRDYPARIVIALNSPAANCLVQAANAVAHPHTSLTAVSAHPTVMNSTPATDRAAFDERVPLSLDLARAGHTAVLDGMLFSIARTHGQRNAVLVTFDRAQGIRDRTDRAVLLAQQWGMLWEGCMTPTTGTRADAV